MSSLRQYLLVGLPYAGKTTLAHELEKLLGIKRITIDDVKAQLGFENTSDANITGEDWQRIFTETDRQVVECLKSGTSVSHETEWTSKRARARARSLATALGIETTVIYVDTPLAITQSRKEENRRTKTRHDVPDDVFDEALREFEIPDAQENTIVFHYGDDVSSWIDANLA